MSTQEDLFSRLFKYRSSDRAHVENFLSEILRELLNRLVRASPRLHLLFIKNLLLSDCVASTERLLRLIATARHSLAWQSQYPIKLGTQSGRLDLVLLGRSKRPLLVVENKVNAAPGVAGQSEDDDGEDETSDTEKLDQLPFYGKWLKRQNPDGGLVCLTYATLLGFPDGDYGVKTRGVALWVRIAEWLSTEIKVRDPLVQYFGKQLRAFLEDKGILNMERKDVELLGRFFEARTKFAGEDNRLEEAEGALVEALKKAKRELTTNHLKWSKPKYNWGALICHGEFSKKPLIQLDYGFTFDRDSAWISSGQGRLVAFAAVVVGTPETFDRLNTQLRRWGTAVPQERPEWPWWYTTRAVEELRESPRGFTLAFAEWVRSKITSAKARVKTVMKNTPHKQKRRTNSPKRKPSRKRRRSSISSR